MGRILQTILGIGLTIAALLTLRNILPGSEVSGWAMWTAGIIIMAISWR